MYRLATNQGVVVVEADDPDVKVIVKEKEQEVTIIDTKTKKEITLKAGKYQIELLDAKDGLRLNATEFTLDRGGRQIVRVSRETVGPIHVLAGHTISSGLRLSASTAATCYRRVEIESRIKNGSAARTSHCGYGMSKPVGRSDGSKTIPKSLRCVAVSPDGRRAVSVGGERRKDGKDYFVRLWDLQSKKLVRRFARGHKDRVNCVAFAADGKSVVSCSDDRTVRVWDVETGLECAATKRAKTREYGAWTSPATASASCPETKTESCGSGTPRPAT